MCRRDLSQAKVGALNRVCHFFLMPYGSRRLLVQCGQRRKLGVAVRLNRIGLFVGGLLVAGVTSGVRPNDGGAQTVAVSTPSFATSAATVPTVLPAATISGRAAVFGPISLPLPTGAVRPYETPVQSLDEIQVVASGSMNPQGSNPFFQTSTPDGTFYYATNAAAANNLSGVVSARFSFLAGMFLGTTAPASSPAALPSLTGAEFLVSPLLGQVFWVGDGLTEAGIRQSYVAPSGATRFVLGFVDAGCQGCVPGGYGDNTGTVSAQVSINSLSRSIPWRALVGLSAAPFRDFQEPAKIGSGSGEHSDGWV